MKRSWVSNEGTANRKFYFVHKFLMQSSMFYYQIIIIIIIMIITHDSDVCKLYEWRQIFIM